MSFWGYRAYVPIAERRANSANAVAKLMKQGRAMSPVVVEGRKIAVTFWGKAWCDNLERYSDFSNRLPRGGAYVRNGSVIDLKIVRGKVEALVSGSEIYTVTIDIAAATPARWTAICASCAGSVTSIVELLQGKLSKHVMERVCREGDGLFPAPKEIRMSCSCPDWAGMCKHVAATLYGVGARLDRDPDLLFTLRGVDRGELISTGADVSITEAAAKNDRVLASDDVAALFAIELDAAPLAETMSPLGGPAIAEVKPPKAASRLGRVATRGRAAPKAAGASKSQAAEKSALRPGPLASATRAGPHVDARSAPAARSGHTPLASEIPAGDVESASKADAARKGGRKSLASSTARGQATSDRVAAERPSAGTRSAVSIGASGRKMALK